MLDLDILKEKYGNKEWLAPEWTDLVLEVLQKNEVAIDAKGKKYPRVRGLRRIGAYIADAHVISNVLRCDRDYSACQASAMRNREQIATAMADATVENVGNPMIAKHLLATAESRAEGRCWAKLLQLNCLTAEEMSASTEASETPEVTVDINEEEEFEQWTNIQKNILNKKCKGMNIDVFKYANYMLEYKSFDAKHIENNNISKKLASKMIDELDKTSRGERGSINFEEQELLGFKAI